MSNVLDRLAHGRSFSRAASHPSGLPEAIRIEPPRSAGTGFEDAYLSSQDFLITAKQIRARRTFVDDEPGLGRLVFLFHLEGRRAIELDGGARYELSRPTFAAYYQAEGLSKRSIWAEGDCETAVLVGFWPENPPRILRGPIGCSPQWRSVFVSPDRPFAWFQQPLSFAMEQAARHILAPRVHSAVLAEYLNAKASELLCLGFDALLSALDLGRDIRSDLESKVQRVQHLIDADLASTPSIRALAEEVALSPTTLSAAFRQYARTSITEYIGLQRMLRARLLLATTDLPMKRIAYEVGYCHASNFCLAFKRHFGMTPRQARRGSYAGES